MPIEIKQLVVKSLVSNDSQAAGVVLAEQSLEELKDSLREDLLLACERMIAESRDKPRER